MSPHSAIVAPGDPAYPRRLAEARAALSLDVRGALRERPQSVAIVGARAATAEAVDRARQIAYALAAADVAIISGGALGIDAAAHRGALDAYREHGAGTTVAVLGCGVDVVYPPRHRDLFAELPTTGGALVSQFPRQAPPRRPHFVQRNRTIAALADLVLVVEAQASSGSLYTARAALDLGRALAAIPGSPGCQRLLAAGAHPVTSADEVRSVLDGACPAPQIPMPDPQSSAAQVLAVLHQSESRDTRELAEQSGLSVREVARALTGLELDGLAVPMPGQCYVRSALANQLLVS
ncbi:MAG: hypothetical protein Tsb0020_21380 [Haliangiales bacterium]